MRVYDGSFYPNPNSFFWPFHPSSSLDGSSACTTTGLPLFNFYFGRVVGRFVSAEFRALFRSFSTPPPSIPKLVHSSSGFVLWLFYVPFFFPVILASVKPALSPFSSIFVAFVRESKQWQSSYFVFLFPSSKDTSSNSRFFLVPFYPEVGNLDLALSPSAQSAP